MAPHNPPPAIGIAASRMNRFLRTLPDATVNTPTLVARQDAPPATVTVYINESGPCTGLNGGEIAGIVIGSVVGALLLLWLLSCCASGGVFGAPTPKDRGRYHYEEPKYRGHRSRHSHSRRRSASMSTPPPVVVREYSRGPARGREYSRGY